MSSCHFLAATPNTFVKLLTNIKQKTMIKKLLLPCLLAILALNIKAQTPYWPYVVPNQDWIKYYSQTDAVVSSPTAIDANSNVYQTGYSGLATSANLIVLKYDSLGVLSYSYAYNNGGADNGASIKVGLLGNAFVCGSSAGTATTGIDYVIIKLNPSGTVAWTKRYDRGTLNPSNNTDEANDVCIDPISGHVYVTGRSRNTAGNYDIVTLKLNGSTGATMWTHVFNGSSSLDDSGVGVVLSPSGTRVYITGNTTNSTTGLNIVTYALNASTGVVLWGPMIANGTANGADKANGIITLGNDLVVCGEITNTGTGLDYFLRRYNGTTGATLFNQTYDFASGINRATSLVRDSAGNVGVTGVVLNGTTYEYHTLLYTTTGVLTTVNKESLGLSTLTVTPRICNDTIAHHYYVAGEVMRNTRDMFVYQITPTGTTAWRQYVDGLSSNVDCATGVVVNGIGVVYAGGRSKNSSANYDITTVKINQTPVYFPPDVPALANEKPIVNHLYYENIGQVRRSDSVKVSKEVLFATMNFFPQTFYSIDKISYKFSKYDTAKINPKDTIQRIDLRMLNANKLAVAYPYVPKQGKVSFMLDYLPSFVIGAQGYERYFIPNIYPSIDLHYYSNEMGMKMYYVLKPGADPKKIQLQVDGATSNSLVSGKLQINGFNTRNKVILDKPIIYTSDALGNPVTVTTTIAWSSVAANKYGFTIGTYSVNMPYAIEIDYGNLTVSSPSSLDNIVNSTYYGDVENEGIKTIDVDQPTGNYLAMGESFSNVGTVLFPTLTGYLVSTPTVSGNTSLLTLVVFDKNGERKAASIYGVTGTQMKVQNAVLNGQRITVVGNNSGISTTYTSVLPGLVPLSNPGAYSNSNGYGFIIQFIYAPQIPVIGGLTWSARFNGHASDIEKTPDGKYLYASAITNFGFSPIDTKTVTGAFNYGVINPSNCNYCYYYQLHKFDSMGVRLWSTILPALNSNFKRTTPYNSMNNSILINLKNDEYMKCKIACDNYGFSLAGETDTLGLIKRNLYNVPIDTTHNGKIDGFFARFNKKDNLVYTTYLGGSGYDGFKDITTANSKEAIMVGYSNSPNNQQITSMPGGTKYVDSSTFANAKAKLLIAKYDTLGNKTYATFYSTNFSNNDMVAWAVTSNLNDKTFICGSDLGTTFNSPITNPPGTYSNFTVNASSSFMIGFNDVMNYPIWNTSMGGRREDVGLTMAYNSKNGNILQGGCTNTTFSTTTAEKPYFPITKDAFNSNVWYQFWINGYAYPGTGPAFITYDGFISTFNISVVTAIDEYFKNKTLVETFNLFPNPAQNECTLAFKQELKGKITIEVYNQMGQLVSIEERTDLVPYSLITLNTQNLTTGLYIVKVSNNANAASKKLLIAK